MCHEGLKQARSPVRQLVRYQKQNRTIPWARVYRLADYVFFSHARHAKGQVECASCHGPVELRDRLVQEVSINMKSCMDCHRARNASNTCTVCHELGQ